MKCMRRWKRKMKRLIYSSHWEAENCSLYASFLTHSFS
jgi:hypothetical protein